MTMLDQLHGVWKAIEQDSGEQPGVYQRRVPDAGVLISHVALMRPSGLRRLAVRVSASSCSHLSLPPGGRGFELVLEKGPSEDITVLHLDERAGAGNAIFSMVCADLISVSKASADEAKASLLLCNRLIAWKRFFESKGDQTITREEYVGLWGELHVMGEMLRAGTPPSDVLRAWLAPIGAAQDYSFSTRAFEVKTSVATEMGQVHISNLMQLDDSIIPELFLVCIHCDFRPDSGTSMTGLRAQIVALIGPDLSATFADALISRGVADPDISPWAQWGFKVSSSRAFAVNGTFPRLRVRDVPEGIVDVTYSLQLGACSAYCVDFPGILQKARFGDLK